MKLELHRRTMNGPAAMNGPAGITFPGGPNIKLEFRGHDQYSSKLYMASRDPERIRVTDDLAGTLPTACKSLSSKELLANA